MRFKSKKPAGFTIIELMIATAVFAIILLVIGAAITTIGRLYYKGIIRAKTQTAARSLIEDISQAIQYSGSTAQVIGPTAGTYPTPNTLCIGSRRYTYYINHQVVDGTPASGQVNHGLVVNDNNAGGCPPQDLTAFDATTMRELLGSKMRLQSLSVAQIVGSTNLYTISAEVIYGEDEVLDSTQSRCLDGTSIGLQFCAVSKLTTTVQKRL